MTDRVTDWFIVARGPVAAYWTPESELATDHITDDDLEAYSLGRLAAAATAPLEEHLLVCEECRERLAGWDEFVGAMRDAVRGEVAGAVTDTFCRSEDLWQSRWGR